MSQKTIVVVGDGQGLGNHIAERFAKEDFRVVLVARRSKALAEYQKEFEYKGIETTTMACDVTDTESIRNTFNQILFSFISKSKKQGGSPIAKTQTHAFPQQAHSPFHHHKRTFSTITTTEHPMAESFISLE